MGFTEDCFRDSDEDLASQAWLKEHPRMQGIEWAELKEKGWQRLSVPQSYAPFAQGGFPTPSGKCEFYSETLTKQGLDPLPTYIAPRESVQSNPLLAQKYPLAIISPPARNFLNSSFANVSSLVEMEKEPQLDIDAQDALPRGIRAGDWVRIFNDRGSVNARARVGDRARPGVVIAPSIWWRKLSPDGCNANEVTGQGVADMGNGAVFYDALVEVELAATAP
jgi:anaerobic selenocysteine-containing dehydrogenase